MPESTFSSADPVQVAHALIAQYLDQLGYSQTLAAFQKDAAHAGVSLTPSTLSGGIDATPALTLPSLVELYMSRQRAQVARAHRRAVRHPLHDQLISTNVEDKGHPWSLTPGPVWSHVHGSNILALQPVFVPRYQFDLSTATLQTTFQYSIASSGADRRLAFTKLIPEIDQGKLFSAAEQQQLEADVIDALEGYHGGAILSVAQPLPVGARPTTPTTQGWRTNQLAGRLLATGGMDGKVVLTDMLHSPQIPSESRKVQILSDHQKFVVRVAFSADGLFFASAGWDKQIHLYQLTSQAQQTPFTPSGSLTQTGDKAQGSDAPVDADEPATMDGVRYTKIHTINTGSSNPETLLFIPAQEEVKDESNDAEDSEDEDEPDEAGDHDLPPRRGEPEFYTGRGTVGGQRVYGRRRRAWLVYTVRGDSDVHYAALPQQQTVEQRLASVHLSSDDSATSRQVRDFEHIAYNTNAHRLDRHSSYSVVETSLHPSGAYLTLQTGPSESSALGLVGSEGAGGHSSRLILLPLHSDGTARVADLWTGVAVSTLGVTRHAWTPSGKTVVVGGEDGWIRSLDLQGRIRASAPIHGSSSLVLTNPLRQGDALANSREIIMSDASTEARERSAALMRQSLAWSRGALGSDSNGRSSQSQSSSGGNTAIRGLVALTDQCILSAGFDRTIRLSFLSTSASSTP